MQYYVFDNVILVHNLRIRHLTQKVIELWLMVYTMNECMRVWILYHEWPNLSGNHAGMAHLWHSIGKRYGAHIRLIKTPPFYNVWPAFIKRLWLRGIVSACNILLRSKDVVFFGEYLGGSMSGDHCSIALMLARKAAHVRRIGLVNLTMSHMRKIYSDDYIRDNLMALDEIVVLGSALKRALEALVPTVLIHSLLHYVDADYYMPLQDSRDAGPIRCIAMGFLQRDFNQLRRIVDACKNMSFDVCIGDRADLQKLFERCSNVKRHAFLPESEMRRLMQQADISISVLEDCVGNNVIVTSLACGLPQVVSDVGSIRDYCSNDHALFCRTDDDFVAALNRLADSQELREQMSKSSRARAESISMEISVEDFYKMLTSTR